MKRIFSCTSAVFKRLRVRFMHVSLPALALTLTLTLALTLQLQAQSSLYLRNSSWLDFNLSVVQRGSYQASSNNFVLYQSQFPNWAEDTEVFATARDSSLMPLLDSVVYEIRISHGADMIKMDLRLLRNGNQTTVESRLHGSGYDTGWSADGNFHNAQVTISGRALELQYKADNDDSQQSMDFRLAIHESEIYHIDAADFANPNVLNVMAYNIQMLPLGVVGLPQAADRGDLLPAQFSPYQDVVIFEEAFDPLPRLLNLIPAMEAAGFVHNSGILNDYLPFNGGVIIFSRWPIERTDQYDFELCGPNAQDCLANKGIMYARILKLGKPYNVFGTHLDAGSDSSDIAAKTLQYAEMRDFIAAQGIAEFEPVIWGGDLNTGANNGHNLYATLRDSIDIIAPNYTGYAESTFSNDPGDVIDHIFADPRFLLPIEADLFITTFTSLDPVLWELSNFSDHRSAIGRFRFPDLAAGPGDQFICPGDPFSFTAMSDIQLSRRWWHDGQQVGNLSGATLTVLSSAASDSGDYGASMAYSHLFGTGTTYVDGLMYPNGSVNRIDSIYFPTGHLAVGPEYCPSAAVGPEGAQLELYPNPTAGEAQLRRPTVQPMAWQVVDVQGRVVREGEWRSESLTLDLSALNDGLYVIHLQGNKGIHFERKITLSH